MNLQSVFPEATKASVIRRNFESMTRLPAIEGLHEARASLVDGLENVWYEYVPQGYDGSQAVPLVVQLHGGGNDGRRWASVTVWHLLAEQEGFIVAYPNSIIPERWNCDERDIEFLAALIRHLQGKYRIDASRVYMQGMSNGEMMTLAFTMVHPEMLAAAGNMTGPSPSEMIGDERPAGALPILQMRGEKDIFFRLPDPPPDDLYAKRYGMNDLNREIWTGPNGLDVLPVLSIHGKDNKMLFRGRSAPLINWEIKGMGHREPPDGAQMLWDYLYSGCRRVDGQLRLTAPKQPIEADTDSAVIAAGSNRVYKGDHLEDLCVSPEGYARFIKPQDVQHFSPIAVGEMFETQGLYIPVDGLKAIFGAEVQKVDPGDHVCVTMPTGDTYEFWADSLLLMQNGCYKGLRKPCVLICGIFYIPIEEFAGDVLGRHISLNDGAMLISGHYAELGRYTARLLKKILGA